MLIAEPGAHIGFAGPSVIEQTIGQKLPEGFQTAEFLFEHGHARPRRAAREPARHACAGSWRCTPTRRARGGDRAALLPETAGAAPLADADAALAREPWDVVQLARNQQRPHTLDYIGLIFDDFQELHGDRILRRTRRSSPGSRAWASSR